MPRQLVFSCIFGLIELSIEELVAAGCLTAKKVSNEQQFLSVLAEHSLVEGCFEWRVM